MVSVFPKTGRNRRDFNTSLVCGSGIAGFHRILDDRSSFVHVFAVGDTANHGHAARVPIGQHVHRLPEQRFTARTNRMCRIAETQVSELVSDLGRRRSLSRDPLLSGGDKRTVYLKRMTGDSADG